MDTKRINKLIGWHLNAIKRVRKLEARVSREGMTIPVGSLQLARHAFAAVLQCLYEAKANADEGILSLAREYHDEALDRIKMSEGAYRMLKGEL